MIGFIERKLNTILDRFENPIETVEYAYKKHEELLMKMKNSMVQVVAARKTLEDHKAKLEDSIERYNKEVEGCVKVERDDLARLVLAKKVQADSELTTIRKSILQTQTEEISLTTLVRNLAIKTEQLKSKKEVLKAQYIARKTIVEVQRTITGLSTDMNDLAAAMKNLEQRTEELQSTGEAIETLMETGILEDTLTHETKINRELTEISNTVEIDKELEKAKLKLQESEQIAVQ